MGYSYTVSGKTSNGSVVSLAKLRGRVKAPEAPIPEFPFFPPQGSILLRQKQEQFEQQREIEATISEHLIPLLAPLQAVSYGPEQVALWREKCQQQFFQLPPANVQISPDKARPKNYQTKLPGYVKFQVDQNFVPRPVTISNLEHQAEQLLTIERVTPEEDVDPGDPDDFEFYAIGHYAYDPLMARWLLVNRWGDNDFPFQTLNLDAPLFAQRQEAAEKLPAIHQELSDKQHLDPQTILQIPSMAERLELLDSPRQIIRYLRGLNGGHPLREINQL